MKTIYIEQNDAVIHRNSEHLMLTQYGKKIASIPIINVQAIVLFNTCQITTPALELLFNKNIDVTYISRSGKIKSRILSANSGGAIVRLAQHQAFLNKERQSQIAGAIVNAKIQNQKTLIAKYKRYYSISDYGEIITQMDEYCNKVKALKQADEIMGFEGISARLFWKCYKELLNNHKFLGRSYRPAKDYVNSALNMAYSFLANEITVCLTAEKFDLEVGFLHSILYGRNSLALDIMEEFRTPFVDSWLLKVFNLNMLNETHFKGEESGFYFNKKGLSKFIELYNEQLEDNNYRTKFRSQILNLKDALLQHKNYEPYIWQ